MLANKLTPILNVSNLAESFVWFEDLGWTKTWEWGEPPSLGVVCSGECEIFLSQNAQGGRGKSAASDTSEYDTADLGVWMSVCVDDVDAVHDLCVIKGLDVTMPPTDKPWGVREMHLRHPDGHLFRIRRGDDVKE